MTSSTAPRLPRPLLRAINKLAAQRAKAELAATWRRHQLALHAEALDLLTAGHAAEQVLRELQADRQ
jgi:hypothetical protein